MKGLAFGAIGVLFAVFAEVVASLYPMLMAPAMLNYTDAMKFCEEQEGVLARVDSLAKQISTFSKVKKYNLRRVWIGLNRLAVDSDRKPWIWKYHGYPDTEVRHPVFWGPAEPNEFRNHSERCVEIRNLPKNTNTSNWNDRPCHHLNNVFCEVITLRDDYSGIYLK